jgi:hypothetical protein
MWLCSNKSHGLHPGSSQYGLKGPAQEVEGAFITNHAGELQQASFSRKRSEDEALMSAAVFEKISIIDLEKLIAVTNKGDIRTIYEGFAGGIRKAPTLLREFPG